MSYKSFKWVRMGMAFFIAMTVSIAVTIDNVYLAVAAVVIGMISMLLVKRSVKEVMVDEMIRSIAGKAALTAYSIAMPILAILSLIFMFSDLSSKSSYLYNLGTVLSYVVLFNMAVYSLAYYYYRKKHGADGE